MEASNHLPPKVLVPNTWYSLGPASMSEWSVAICHNDGDDGDNDADGAALNDSDEEAGVWPGKPL